MRYLLALLLFYGSLGTAKEPAGKYMGLAGVSLGSRLGLGATIYGTYELEKSHSGQDLLVGSVSVNERGFGVGAGYTLLTMAVGPLLEAGYINMDRDRFRDGPRDFLSVRASLVFMGLQAGVGVLQSGRSSYGEVFAGFILPFYPWTL